jgi:hypothetical protein
MDGFIDALYERYGSAERYLLDRVGIDEKELLALKDFLLEDYNPRSPVDGSLLRRSLL